MVMVQQKLLLKIMVLNMDKDMDCKVIAMV